MGRELERERKRERERERERDRQRDRETDRQRDRDRDRERDQIEHVRGLPRTVCSVTAITGVALQLFDGKHPYGGGPCQELLDAPKLKKPQKKATGSAKIIVDHL